MNDQESNQKNDTKKVTRPGIEAVHDESFSAEKNATMRVDIPEGTSSESPKDTLNLSEKKLDRKETLTPSEAEKEITQSLEEAYKSARQKTMKVDIDEDKETPSLEPTKPDTAQKRQTTRIDLSEVMASEESSKRKRKTGTIPSSTVHKVDDFPKTIKIKRSDALPLTQVTKKTAIQKSTLTPPSSSKGIHGTKDKTVEMNFGSTTPPANLVAEPKDNTHQTTRRKPVKSKPCI
ncbi:MAG: hypothetical protein GKR87_15045 [Kiritimatiellae bacterium]|nr:hypothetical protein [Kiritimatiellia bacterium]